MFEEITITPDDTRLLDSIWDSLGGSTPDAADDVDPHEAIAQAMVEYAHESKLAGEDAASGIEVLRALLDDPAALAEALQGSAPDGTIAKCVGLMVVRKAWNESAHPRGKNGHFIAKGDIEAAKSDPAKAAELRDKVAPKDAAKLEKQLGEAPKGPGIKQQRAVAKERGAAILKKMAKSADLRGKFTADDLHALADHLSDPAVTVAHLREVRQAMRGNAINAGYGGAKRKEGMVAALVAKAKEHAFEERLKEQGIKGEAADEMRRAAGMKTREEPAVEPSVDSIPEPPPGEKESTPEALNTPPKRSSVGKEPHEMTSAEHAVALDNLRPNAQGTGGDTRGGMGRSTSEKGLAARNEAIQGEKSRLLAGKPATVWRRYDENDNPYFSTTPPKKGDQDYEDAASVDNVNAHREIVSDALAAGKPVPPEVLKDYPDLAAKYAKPPTPTPDPSTDMELLDQPADAVAPGSRTGDAVARDEAAKAKRTGTPKVGAEGNGEGKAAPVVTPEQAEARKWKKNDDGTYTAPNGVVWKKAAAGGEDSPVTGERFKGGSLMPIHGLSQKVPKGEGVGGPSEPVKPNEDKERGGGSGGRIQLSPEEAKERYEAQKRWDEMNAGPLGKVKWLGEKPNSKAHDPMHRHTNIKKWREHAESMGPEGVQQVINELEPKYHAAIDSHYQKRREENEAKKAAGDWNPTYDRDVAPDDADWHKNEIKRRAQEAIGMFPGGKGHEKKVPGSHYARELLDEMQGKENHPEGTSNIDILHSLNKTLTDAVAPKLTTPSPEPSAPVPKVKPAAPAKAKPPAGIDHAIQTAMDSDGDGVGPRGGQIDKSAAQTYASARQQLADDGKLSVPDAIRLADKASRGFMPDDTTHAAFNNLAAKGLASIPDDKVQEAADYSGYLRRSYGGQSTYPHQLDTSHPALAAFLRDRAGAKSDARR